MESRNQTLKKYTLLLSGSEQAALRTLLLSYLLRLAQQEQP